MNMSQKRIVAVLGMHRSGTSAITRGLKVLGVDLGTRLLQPQEGINEKGFWEDGDIAAFNNELLAALGRKWDSLQPILADELRQPRIEAFKLPATQLLRKKISEIDCFGLKDPRMPRLLPFWQDVFAHLDVSTAYVIACRNPMSVAHSLLKRDGFPLEKGYLLWLEHMLGCMRQTQGRPRVFVDYDLMLIDPAQQLARIAQALDLPFVADSPAFEEYRQDFLEEGLRHNDFASADLCLDPTAPADVLVLAQLLQELVSDGCSDDAALAKQLDELYASLEKPQALYRLSQHYDESNARHIEILGQREEQIRALDGQLADLGQALAERGAQLESCEETLIRQVRQVEQLEGALAEHVAEVDRLGNELAKRNEQGKASEHELRQQAQLVEHMNDKLQRYNSLRYLLRSLAVQTLRRAGVGRLREEYQRHKVVKSGLFDADAYLGAYPDIRDAGIDPLSHYMAYGWREGRNPSALFTTQAYLDTYADVRLAGINPLLHYLRAGRRERRAIQTASGEWIHLAIERTRSARLRSLLDEVVARPELLRKFVSVARRQGLRHALATVAARSKPALPAVPGGLVSHSPGQSGKDDLLYSLFRVVPYYLNPYLEQPPVVAPCRIAVHLHFYYEDMADGCIAYLNNIPAEFDLFVSVPEGRDIEACRVLFRKGIPLLRQLTVENVPNRGRDIAPFIVQFGNRLSQYDVIGHFHTKKSPHCQSLNDWFRNLMDVLCGSRSGVAQILKLLAGDGKVVYPAGRRLSREHAGWSDNLEIARDLLQRFGHFDIADFPCVEFPQGSMFWGRTDALRQFLRLDLTFSDFPIEPIEEDGTLAHALERLILIYTTPCPGRNYRLESPALSLEPQEYYEEQYDYSGEIVHHSIKVLAYYLPQFHPTPENDEWHGKGFTEWYKVRAANPLFQGHFQQHVPHEDVGYYHLDSPEQLGRQAEQMRQAGVHGMIFYHYWFSGKLILEKPAQMLLANPQIDMPYSFCWANENWTRRWDGNEQEVLLGQVYSQDDARDFIRYLMPFFKDERYIKVDGRPLLFVYRPSAMEHCGDYLAIWREECKRNGVPAPYVVATLTRGAVKPQAYGMDAAVERVLQDWTGGAVPNIKERLRPYWPINGSVLDYPAVADHYMGKPLDNDYVLFRSLVPTWDNTARYGSEAFALHGFTTAKMQEWMEQLIRYSEENLPADRRFVVVNAWNEWAEGAHLEPDTRFGYGYLNAIGRALCGHRFADIEPVRLQPAQRIALELGDAAAQRLQSEPQARRKFLRCLASSGLHGAYSLCTADAELSAALGEAGIDCIATEAAGSAVQADYTLAFGDLCLFPDGAIEALLKMARRHPGFDISATLRNDPGYLHGVHTRNFEIAYVQRSIMELRGKQPSSGFKACPQASCFVIGRNLRNLSAVPVDKVSTVIRFHCKGERRLLDNAIFSLLAQGDCRVQVYLTLQDLDDEGVEQLQDELECLPWDEGCQPVLRRYISTAENPDLRALMLNDGLKAVGGGYAAFLDYDDVLFPHAYRSLLARLKATGSNATFARVYSTAVDAETGLLLRRDRVYDYGHSYEEFVRCNHAPLHSFMLDLQRIDLSSLVHFDDMKYMEDYYLTLQLFNRRDTDWASLRHDLFIGDYIHRVGDVSHTLAISDAEARQKLVASEAFQRCEQRIKALRERLTS